MVAVEIIISTAIQINPLAAESRQATTVPQALQILRNNNQGARENLMV